MLVSYQEMYLNTNNMKYVVEKRLEIVRYAFKYGYKKTSRYYNCSRTTVKKWVRRYQLDGKKGLRDKTRKPKTSPKTISKRDINKITNKALEAKMKGKIITVKNIRRSTKIAKYSDVTINRYINKATKNKRNKKKGKTTNGSLEFKKELKPFQLIQIDIKYLTDIDNLKPYFKDRNLMKYQITARDVTTGFPIISYCMEKSVTYTKKFLEEVLHPFLSQFEYLDMKTIKIQTDNGKEFTNKDNKTNKGEEAKTSTFTVFIEENYKSHKTIIPGHCTAQSEVETFHWSIERDCLGWEDIVDNETLIKYTTEYIERYIKTEIKARGYSPIEKIKKALDVSEITIPKPQLLTV